MSQTVTPGRRRRPMHRASRDGWPLPPPMQPAWMARRATWWLGLLRAGRVHRFHADMAALTGGYALPDRRQPLLRYGEALRQEWRARTAAGPRPPRRGAPRSRVGRDSNWSRPSRTR